MGSLKYSVWLIPCEEQREALRQTIDSLSARFGTPSFAPHVTVCSGVWEKEEAELIGLIGRLGTGIPLTLTSGEIEWTDHWSTFLFLRLSGADDFFEHAATAVEGAHLPVVGPHLSLLYGLNKKGIDRAALCQELAGHLPDVLRFDALALVSPASGRWEDVNRWETLYSLPVTA